MRGFATSPNPYMSGLRPKSFFSARVAMLKREQMMKKIDKNAYPEYSDHKDEIEKKAA